MLYVVKSGEKFCSRISLKRHVLKNFDNVSCVTGTKNSYEILSKLDTCQCENIEIEEHWLRFRTQLVSLGTDRGYCIHCFQSNLRPAKGSCKAHFKPSGHFVVEECVVTL